MIRTALDVDPNERWCGNCSVPVPKSCTVGMCCAHCGALWDWFQVLNEVTALGGASTEAEVETMLRQDAEKYALEGGPWDDPADEY